MDSHQYEDELFLTGILRSGDITKLAQIRGVSCSEISQQQNPNESKVSDFHKGARWLRCLTHLDGDQAEKALAYYSAIVRAARTVHPADLPTLVADLNQEHAEFVGAHLQSKPLHIQTQELMDVCVRVERVTAALDPGIIERKPDLMSRGARPKVEARRKAS